MDKHITAGRRKDKSGCVGWGGKGRRGWAVGGAKRKFGNGKISDW